MGNHRDSGQGLAAHPVPLPHQELGIRHLPGDRTRLDAARGAGEGNWGQICLRRAGQGYRDWSKPRSGGKITSR